MIRLSVLAVAFVLLAASGCELVIDTGDDSQEPAPEGDVTTPPPEPSDDEFVPFNCGNDQCCEACNLVADCTGLQRDFDTCFTTCWDSEYVAALNVQCLAARIFWIDEEGCGSILEAYESFDPADTCEE